MTLTPDELSLAAEACRALAERYREEANRRKDPALRREAIARSLHAEQLADRLDAERTALN
jgi:hypothetical protein